MPQMAPILWAPLYLFFILCFTLMMSSIHHSPQSQLTKPNFTASPLRLNWLW